jgi:DNA helicase HerA-like ATPase
MEQLMRDRNSALLPDARRVTPREILDPQEIEDQTKADLQILLEMGVDLSVDRTPLRREDPPRQQAERLARRVVADAGSRRADPAFDSELLHPFLGCDVSDPA